MATFFGNKIQRIVVHESQYGEDRGGNISGRITRSFRHRLEEISRESGYSLSDICNFALVLLDTY